MEKLRKILKGIDGRGYKAYKDIRGRYDFGDFDLHIDHVQGDPFAAPSRIRVVVPAGTARLPKDTYRSRSRRIALEDYLTRSFADAIRLFVSGQRGSGKSGAVMIDEPKQEILERSSCFVNDGAVEVRFRVGLPAAGRRVLGREAEAILCGEIPRVVGESLRYGNLDAGRLALHINVNEDQDALRELLSTMGLTAFIADGSVLPRRSGVDDRPLSAINGAHIVPFVSPETMRTTVTLPNAKQVAGMGIAEGITLIVGGGFHGKSTLLRALERGVYNHIPGDGRELASTRRDAVKIRSEDGRSIAGVDIRPFINNLPLGTDTAFFSTPNASGSTSQAANIIEALEMGCRLLLIDEDTSATNFMIRDERMQALIKKEKEPITPFLDKVGSMHHDLGVSTVLVMGGSGDYFDAADRIVMMDSYRPIDVTERVAEIVTNSAARRRIEGGEAFGDVTPRVPLRCSFDASRGRRDVKIDAKGMRTILFGRQSIDLSAVEQIVDIGQTRVIGDIIHRFAERYVEREFTFREGLDKILDDMEREGMDMLSRFKEGDYAMPRIFEIAAAVNRMRSLIIREPA